MSNKRYWRGIEEYTNDLEFVKNAEREFPEYIPSNEDEESEGPNRRDFLKLMGFSVAAAALASCETPVKKAIPYLNKPVDVDPTIPNFYASTYFDEGEYASILVKTREGRPIKVEGNEFSPINSGKTSARVQASVLDLYDGTRYQGFVRLGATASEKKSEREAENIAIDKEILAKLASARNIRLVTQSVISPTMQKAIDQFKAKYPSTQHVQYDVFSQEGILAANEKMFGKAMVPSYDFRRAQTIVSFGADFLGTWISPTEFAAQYARNRKVSTDKREMSRHYQFEANLSLSGANADYRIPVKASQERSLVAALYKKIVNKSKFADEALDAKLEMAAKDLLLSQGKSLVISNSNDENVQLIVNAINQRLDNYGKTIKTDRANRQYQGRSADMDQFVSDVVGGRVGAVIFCGVNPVYTHPRGGELKEGLSKVGLKVSLAQKPDETSVLCDFVCPDNHYLESWGDAEPRDNHLSLRQPAITSIFQTRQAGQSLLTWAGNNQAYYDFLRATWQQEYFDRQTMFRQFESFWEASVHNGVWDLQSSAPSPATQGANTDKETSSTVDLNENGVVEEGEVAPQTPSFNVNTALSQVESTYKTGEGTELSLYQKVATGSGSQANNPWIQEMPDPISKACWDNYLCVSQKMAADMGLRQGSIVTVKAGEVSFNAPILVQPGQAPGTVSIAIGYGREVCGKVGQGIGVNVYPVSGQEFSADVSIAKTGDKMRIAQTQTHQTVMNRKSVLQEVSLVDYKKDEYAGKPHFHVSGPEGEMPLSAANMWKGHIYPNHSWAITIDLNSCIGCGACTIACQAENNVPVVGKKEVLMRREMHWIRIDRYYSSDADENDMRGLEEASENPEVTFMPMMCQHCSNAPCETVCPVLATTHSTEGLNQMVYNRCIGTRYCANNCPYKVRRFNWFHYAEDTRFTDLNYTQTSDLGKMVLNPDVTVRSRGVMEKCTMCIQRIQAGKLEAKKEKRHVRDGEIQTACQQVCPTSALTFGDQNDLNSKVAKSLGLEKEIIPAHPEEGIKEKWKLNTTEPRAYYALEEINVKPQMAYLRKIRNVDEERVSGGHGGGEHHEESAGEEESHG